MSALNSSPETNSSSAPGGLLEELERRQDEVLAQIDELDAKVSALLKEMGVTETDSAEIETGKYAA
ncbi:hypothetical protein FF011L_18580 [Roseimaritima multifibrata]|uniref:Uncharacterized protein n=1 Tax=Roseimaritima multifibrata TaxID=1930274 RepID=A0A517MDY5_9BACT|nr:hypothetical protein [Roseimaritima multifibrata]QDS93103.1 hypothetical protein FF011L_18580 [Roseimaritima multifibrata]